MLKHVKDKVILERMPASSTHCGLEISDGARVKNYKSVICSCHNDKFVGQETHVPHYGVYDVDFDGAEYAITKFERLFVVKEGDQHRPINGYVMVRKCVNDHVRDESGEIALYMTDNHIENTNWVEIIDVAEDCRKMSRDYIGMFFPCPESDERVCRIGYSDEYCVHEDLIQFITNGG